MLEWRFDNQWSKNEMLTINFKVIGLLEVQNLSSMVHVLVSRLESTRGPRKNGGGEKVADGLSDNSSRTPNGWLSTIM